MIRVYIGLGSNLDSPKAQLDKAVVSLQALSVSNFQVSQYYASKPQGPQDQPDFLNAVAEFDTELSAESLLSQLQKIEQDQGKIKKRHWGERLIDLDLLLYGDEIIDLPTLKVPHPFLAERDFVLLPLQEIAPEIILPKWGRIPDLIANLGQSYLYPYRENEK